MIGRRCKGGDVLSRPVLIARYLFRVLSFCPSDLSQVTYCGGYGGGDPPLPIPNREVKPAGADGSAPPGVRVGSCRFSGVPETIRFVPGTPSFMPGPANQRSRGQSARPSGPRIAATRLPARRLCPAPATTLFYAGFGLDSGQSACHVVVVGGIEPFFPSSGPLVAEYGLVSFCQSPRKGAPQEPQFRGEHLLLA